MTERDDIESHATIAAVRNAFDVAASLDPGDSPLALERLERIRKLAGAISSLVEVADVDLVTGTAFDEMLPHLTSAVGGMETFRDAEDPDEDDLWDASVELGRALTAATPLLVAAPLVAPDQQREAAQGFRRSAGQLLRSIVEDGEGVTARLEEIRAAAEDIATSQVARDAEVAAALAGLKSEIQNQEARVAAILAQLQGQFLEAEAARQEAATAAASAAKAASDEQRATLDASAANVIAKLEQYRGEAAQLVNAVGQNAFAGGHGVYANEERARADFWRWVTVVSIVIVAILGGWYLVTVGTSEFTIQGFWVRTVLILPFAVLAAYAARQSGRHRINEISARNRALELLALDPYLALLPEEVQHEVKAKMTDRFFGGSVQNLGEDSAGIQEIVEAVLRERPQK
jgi:hypothetical protein